MLRTLVFALRALAMDSHIDDMSDEAPDDLEEEMMQQAIAMSLQVPSLCRLMLCD